MNAYPSRPNPRVLVTPRSMTRGDNAAVDRLVAAGLEVVIPAPGLQPTRAQLLEVLPEIDVWIAGVEPIDDALLGSAPWLRAVCRNGAGIDSVDVEAAKARNISVLPARGANALGVAELALGLIIASFRGLLPAATALKDGRWERSTGRELAGSTLGIAGFGAIGRHLARLAQGCGMTVLAYDPYVSEAPSGVTLLPLESLLASADVVSLHLPPLAAGPLLGVEQLALLRPGAFVLNTARAELVDGAAMLAALDSGAVAGYAVDAFATEPPVIDALLAHPRVLATPHLGAATAESISRASEAAVDNALGVLGLE